MTAAASVEAQASHLSLDPGSPVSLRTWAAPQATMSQKLFLAWDEPVQVCFLRLGGSSQCRAHTARESKAIWVGVLMLAGCGVLSLYHPLIRVCHPCTLCSLSLPIQSECKLGIKALWFKSLHIILTLQQWEREQKLALPFWCGPSLCLDVNSYTRWQAMGTQAHHL